MTTIFGNPGSTELPMLADFPSTSATCSGCRKPSPSAWPTATRRPAAAAPRQPPHGTRRRQRHGRDLQRAGQQGAAAGDRRPAGPRLMTMQANLTNRDAARVPHPFVKWSYEPPRAEDVPAAIARGIHLASLPPPGPVFVSVPMDDWGAEVDDGQLALTLARRVNGRAVADPRRSRRSRHASRRPTNPRVVAGPDIDASGGWEAAVALAENAAAARVGDSPRPVAGGSAFPRTTRTTAASCRPRSARPGRRSPSHDLVVVVGSVGVPVLPVPPGPGAARGHRAGRDHQRSRGGGARPDGRGARRRRQADAGGAAGDRRAVRPRGAASRSARPPTPEDTVPLTPSSVHATLLAERPSPTTAIVVLESPSSTLALRNQLRLSRPGRYYFGAGGGLGFGLAGALGVQIAQPDRRVVCVLGEGSAQYAITGFWSRSAYKLPVTFLVLRNAEYAILKWFAEHRAGQGAPGLDLPKPWTGRDRAELRRCRAAGHRAATSCARRSRARSPSTARRWSRSASPRACRSSSQLADSNPPRICGCHERAAGSRRPRGGPPRWRAVRPALSRPRAPARR